MVTEAIRREREILYGAVKKTCIALEFVVAAGRLLGEVCPKSGCGC